MSDPARDKVAQILRCSGVLLPNDYTPTWAYARKIDELAAELADAAIAAHLEALGGGGYVVVALPKPDAQDADGRVVATWNIGDHDTVSLDCFKRIHNDGCQYDATEAREFAAAFLAAADAAEAS